jgi:hypothetical protein
MSVGGITGGVDGRIVVGVDDVARGASAVAIVAGLIVRPGETQQRIEQASFLKADGDRVGSKEGSKTALAELHVGLAGLFFQRWNSDFRLFLASAFENAEHVAGLGNFPTLDRIEVRQHTFCFDFLWRWSRKCYKALRFAVGRVAFAKMWILEREGAIVVESCAPEHRAVGHHAGSNFLHFGSVATDGAASCRRDAQVAGVHELDVVPVFLEPVGVNTDGIRTCVVRKNLRLGMRFLLDALVLGGAWSEACRCLLGCIAAVAIGAADSNRRGCVHGAAIRRCVAALAPAGFGGNVILALL